MVKLILAKSTRILAEEIKVIRSHNIIIKVTYKLFIYVVIALIVLSNDQKFARMRFFSHF